MILKRLIEWLESQDENTIVQNGFGEPHCDRGFYENLAFDPVKETTIKEMLKQAKLANGSSFYGYKGGTYEMGNYTDVFIGFYHECGEPINESNLRLWGVEEKLNDDDYIKILRKSDPCQKEQKILTYDKCKDGIEIEVPTLFLKNLIESARKFKKQ